MVFRSNAIVFALGRSSRSRLETKKLEVAGTSALCCFCSRLESDPKHKLQLARQAGSRVWRSLVVIIVVEVVGRADDSEAAGIRQICHSIADHCARRVNEAQRPGI